MFKFLKLILLVASFFQFSAPAWSQEADSSMGRYQLHTGEITILIDTATGKAWRFAEPMEWHPMTFHATGEESVSPVDGKSALERWGEDAATRRLKLLTKDAKDKDANAALRETLSKLLE